MMKVIDEKASDRNKISIIDTVEAAELAGGCLVRTSRLVAKDIAITSSESTVFVPGARIEEKFEDDVLVSRKLTSGSMKEPEFDDADEAAEAQEPEGEDADAE